MMRRTQRFNNSGRPVRVLQTAGRSGRRRPKSYKSPKKKSTLPPDAGKDHSPRSDTWHHEDIAKSSRDLGDGPTVVHIERSRKRRGRRFYT